MFIIFVVFIIFKQDFKMNAQRDELLDRALRQLEAYLGRTGLVTNEDGELVQIMGKLFAVEVKASLEKNSYNFIADIVKERARTKNAFPLLVCGQISDELMAVAKADGIYTLDAAGNCEITLEGGPFLSVRGRKSEFRKQSTGLVFRTAGLRVLYYLLLDPLNIRKPFREIKAATDVSVATVKNVVDALTPQYCFESREGRNLTRLPELLDFWAQQYNQLQKPRLQLTRMAFAPGKEKNWEKIPLPQGMYWGGECGAFLKDGYLFPQRFEIYTEIPTRELLKTGAVIPSQEGNITVYEKFWQQPQSDIHPLVIYADLMGTADGRCREEAQRIHSHDLSYLL